MRPSLFNSSIWKVAGLAFTFEGFVLLKLLGNVAIWPELAIGSRGAPLYTGIGVAVLSGVILGLGSAESVTGGRTPR